MVNVTGKCAKDTQSFTPRHTDPERPSRRESSNTSPTVGPDDSRLSTCPRGSVSLVERATVGVSYGTYRGAVPSTERDLPHQVLLVLPEITGSKPSVCDSEGAIG